MTPTSRPATYTELRKHAQSEGCGWFVSRFYALLGVMGGTQVITIPCEQHMNKNQPTTGGTFYAADTRPLWMRLLSRMFPSRQPEIPEDLEGWAPSYMQTHVVCKLDWHDRLRVLVSGKVHVQTNTKTDVSVGRMHSWSSVHVEPPFER